MKIRNIFYKIKSKVKYSNKKIPVQGVVVFIFRSLAVKNISLKIGKIDGNLWIKILKYGEENVNHLGCLIT